MANQSLYAAIERLWQHVLVKVGTKADSNHLHDDVYETKEDAQSKYNTLTNAKSDWNQNDENALGYINNRPFYAEDPVETTILNNISITTTANNGYAQLPEDFALENFQTYRVVFDGVEYSCKCYMLWGTPVIGNGLIAGAETGGNNEPFLCVGGHKLIYISTAGTYTISVVEFREEIHVLDEKFISYKPGMIVEGTLCAETFNDCSANYATGMYSHAEGYNTEASGNYSHAQGFDTTASGNFAHVEGYKAEASGSTAHAEGFESVAAGDYSHAEGHTGRANGDMSHAEGHKTTANGHYSHAEGLNTISTADASHVQGKYNVEDTAGDYAHIVGNGSANTLRSNAHTIDWDGNAWFAGDIYVGGTGQNDTGNVVKLATITEVDDKLSALSTGLPEVSAADNGKILMVVNGAWALVDLPALSATASNGNVTLELE